jgi:predicted phosphodiesterase
VRLFKRKIKNRFVADPKPGRIAVFSDIHSNLEALRSVFEDAEKQGVTRFLCAGDIVGYGADPAACLDLIREKNCPVVQGNHDLYMDPAARLGEFNSDAKNAIVWTRENLSEADKRWLLDLPIKVDFTETLESRQVEVGMVHSSLYEPEEWHYLISLEKASKSLHVQTQDVVFFGHTHVPSLFSMNPENGEIESCFPMEEGVNFLKEGWRHLITAGSIGQPRDGNPRAAYAIYDPEASTIELRRVSYRISATQKKIKAAGLPERNSERLTVGR